MMMRGGVSEELAFYLVVDDQETSATADKPVVRPFLSFWQCDQTVQ